MVQRLQKSPPHKALAMGLPEAFPQLQRVFVRYARASEFLWCHGTLRMPRGPPPPGPKTGELSSEDFEGVKVL